MSGSQWGSVYCGLKCSEPSTHPSWLEKHTWRLMLSTTAVAWFGPWHGRRGTFSLWYNMVKKWIEPWIREGDNFASSFLLDWRTWTQGVQEKIEWGSRGKRASPWTIMWRTERKAILHLRILGIVLSNIWLKMFFFLCITFKIQSCFIRHQIWHGLDYKESGQDLRSLGMGSPETWATSLGLFLLRNSYSESLQNSCVTGDQQRTQVGIQSERY